MADKVDRRVARTKKAIEDAFEKLVAETDYSKITVSAIAKEANINRKTFYLHYSSVEDVLDSMTKRSALCKRLRNAGFSRNGRSTQTP